MLRYAIFSYDTFTKSTGMFRYFYKKYWHVPLLLQKVPACFVTFAKSTGMLRYFCKKYRHVPLHLQKVTALKYRDAKVPSYDKYGDAKVPSYDKYSNTIMLHIGVWQLLQAT